MIKVTIAVMKENFPEFVLLTEFTSCESVLLSVAFEHAWQRVRWWRRRLAEMRDFTVWY